MIITTLLDEMNSALSAIEGLRTFDHYPSIIVAPAALLSVEAITYDETFDGEQMVDLSVTVLVSRNDDRSGQAKLFDYLSTASVKEAVEEASFTDADVRVTGVNPVTALDVGGTSYYAAVYGVSVLGGPATVDPGLSAGGGFSSGFSSGFDI